MFRNLENNLKIRQTLDLSTQTAVAIHLTVTEEAAGPQDTIAVFIFALFTGNGFLRNLGVPQVNGLYGGQSCILAQLVDQSEWEGVIEQHYWKTIGNDRIILMLLKEDD
ncbi:hypothetical protein TNCV_5048281 [Trichonephila clavipes]|nr:hypothetical protein TNCV_5048281 [Trichonephila clavipes]